ncbi:MAG: hypothetical protein VKL39_15180 [Leptolyngbyaceae bacterium]|nr:hypothetical protein [Leptolyngbyaceae bacterium]
MVAPQTIKSNSLSGSNRWKNAIAAFLVMGMVAIATLLSIGLPTITHPTPIAVSIPSGDPSEIGAVDAESITDIPFWVWVVLPRLFPEKLPGAGGYTSLGLTWEQGRELPTGFTRETRSLTYVVLNDPENATFDVERYVQFLFDCARDPRFNADFILPEITYNINLSPWEKLVYRFSAIPNTKKALLADAESTGQ